MYLCTVDNKQHNQMVRLARIKHTGSVVAIITGDEQSKTVEVEGKQQYPVKFMGEPETVNFIVQNGEHFKIDVGLKFNDLEDWSV